MILMIVICVIWLTLTALTVRRVGWLLGLILSLTLVPIASSVLAYGVVLLFGPVLRSILS
jgi:hypothetical protein